MTAKKILIVEDNPALLRGLKDNFQAQGYQVRTANDGERGLDALLRDPPDLLLLDLLLPKMNGYEICRLARSHRLNTPIMMLSAKTQEDDVVRGLELGADDYVTKPFGIRELMARAKRLSRGGGLAPPCLIAGPSRELPVTPPGLGVRLPSGAFNDSTYAPKRQRAGALQDADAPMFGSASLRDIRMFGESPLGQEPTP
jgi:DNA-binding response OmpR family regulator